MKTLQFILILFMSQTAIFANICESNSIWGGDWSDDSTWSGGTAPACGDTIIIAASDVVTITSQQDYSGCESAMFLIIDGTLNFPVNGPKLRLPCGSGVTINSGGLLTANGGAGGGGANFLEICGIVVWKKSDGDQSGPLVFELPLPIELIAFDANCLGKKVQLDWATASEINNDYFTIERSSDAVNFTPIATVNGNGNSSAIINYSWTDDGPLNGTAYYRLKQTDFNSAFEYHGIRSITCEQSGNISIYPNPFENSFTVQLSENSTYPLTIEVLDYLWRSVYSKTIETNLTVIAIDKLSKGTYFVKVFGETTQVVERIVKIN